MYALTTVYDSGFNITISAIRIEAAMRHYRDLNQRSLSFRKSGEQHLPSIIPQDCAIEPNFGTGSRM